MSDAPRQDPAGRSGISLRAKGVAVLLAPLAALFAVLFSVYWMEGGVQQADQTVLRAYDARSDLAQLRSLLLEAETSLNAYIATGQTGFLANFDAARKTVRDMQSRLATDIGELTAAEMELLDQVRRGGPAALIDRQKAAMADLQARIALLSAREEQRLTEARSERDRARLRLFRTVILCGVLGPLGALAIHLLIAGRI